MENFYCVFTFHITQHALLFEKLMKNSKIDIKLMPVPRQISSSCGTAAKVPCELEDHIRELCQQNHIPIDSYYKIESQKNNSWFSKYINK